MDSHRNVARQLLRRRLRRKGVPLEEIALRLGVKLEALVRYIGSDRPLEPLTNEQVREIRARMPEDTRTFAERWLGDLPPGRSALDQARGDSQ